MRYQLDAPILAHERIADCEYEMTLLSPQIANSARPGQFLQILYDMTYNPFTRRPFSVYRVDREKGTFSIVYLARGVFTQGLRNKQVGQSLSVVGPLGNWFTPPDTPDATLILVGGGVGAPPIYFFASELSAEGRADRTVVVINGARSENLLVGVREFSELDIEIHFVTDDGTFGARGVVTDVLLEQLETRDRPVYVYACGPTGMLRAVGNLCIERDLPCQVSVETPMPCGLGVCMGCVVKIKDAGSPNGFTYQRSCYEGPVFRAEEILWE